MADFHQPRHVPTMHALGRGPFADLGAHLAARCDALGRCTTLVLPALASELEGPAFPRIIRELRHATFLDRIIVVLGHATASQLAAAETLLASVPARVSLVSLDDPSLGAIRTRLRRAAFDVEPEGKGYACWVGLCAALADAGSDVIALHDCDIETYDAHLVARLVSPLVLPDPAFDFAKGYYPRATTRLHGRVTRLLVAPLLRALESLSLPTTLPAFLAAFRYPLSGEVAFSRALVRELPVHVGWGLEVGTLAEVYQRQSRFRVCQVDIAGDYEHRHRRLDVSDGVNELAPMVEQVAGTLLDALRRERVTVDARLLRYLLSHYRQEARWLMAAYEADAAVNGLPHDRELEERTVEAFAAIFTDALGNGGYVAPPPLPSWKDVSAAAPEVAMAFAGLARSSGLANAVA